MSPRENIRKSTRVSDALLGVAYLAMAGLLLIGCWAMYSKAFANTVDVELATSSVGNALQKGSDVKLHGVPVGEVRSVTPSPEGAIVTLALEPAVAADLPSTTTARLLPKTLFGERYVSLVTPVSAPSTGLGRGDLIHQDHSDEAVELEELFDEMLPVLQALKPDKLQATLGEMAAALRGQGQEIGDSMSAWNAYLTHLNPHVDTMTDDFDRLGRVAMAWNEAVPDLLDAFDSMRTTSATMVSQRQGLTDLYASVISAADESEGWVSANQKTIIELSAKSRDALHAVRPYADQFPCVFESATSFIDTMDRTLGKGTNEPGIHVNLEITPQRGAYQPGTDTPRFNASGGPRCPYTTGARPASTASGSSPSAGTPQSIAAPPSTVLASQAATGLGAANSPAENQLIAELMSAGSGTSPADYPGWASLLVGPSLRGIEVSIS